MKTSKAGQSIVAAAILTLFMLSATAHALSTASSNSAATASSSTETQETQEEVDKCGTTTTTNTASETATSSATSTQSQETQSGEQVDQGVQGQTGEDEPCGTNNQVGPDEKNGDNVNVVDLSIGDQGQIGNAESDHTIAGEVQVNDDNSVTSTATDSSFTISSTEQSSGGLDVTVSGQNVAGPRSFIISLSHSMDPTTHTFLVTLDGSRVTQASSVDQVLHPSAGSGSSYIVVRSTSGYQLLVSVPHFSTHQLTILPLALGPSQGFFSISEISLVLAIIAITTGFAVVFATRKRIYTPLV
jgi:uncharacterized low-complexity protein